MDGGKYGRGSDRLKDRVAIVTGAGSRADGIGNGRAASILLARNGARIVLVDMKTEWAERTRDMIEAEGGEAVVVTADVTKPEDCARIVQAGVDRWRRVDILVNNVGIGGAPGTAVEVDLAAWNEGLSVNVTSMMLMSKYSIPEMIKTGAGSIINISSVAGIRGGIANLLYPTSKGAVVNMTRAMAYHHGRDNIRVNCIIPTPNGKVSNIGFGGPEMNWLYVTAGDKVFRRKVKTVGAHNWQPPHKPAPPGL